MIAGIDNARSAFVCGASRRAKPRALRSMPKRRNLGRRSDARRRTSSTMSQLVGAPRSTMGTGTYSLRDAALLLHVPYGKLRRWATGYWYSATEEDRYSEPVVPPDTDDLDERIVSFHELMELAVVAFFRNQGVSMQVVRAARARAQQLFRTEFPFATERL